MKYNLRILSDYIKQQNSFYPNYILVLDYGQSMDQFSTYYNQNIKAKNLRICKLLNLGMNAKFQQKVASN